MNIYHDGFTKEQYLATVSSIQPQHFFTTSEIPQTTSNNALNNCDVICTHVQLFGWVASLEHVADRCAILF